MEDYVDEFDQFEKEQQRLSLNQEQKISSFEKNTQEKKQVEKPANISEMTDFLLLPTELDSNERLKNLHNFKMSNSNLYQDKYQYLFDDKTGKFYKLEKRKCDSCFRSTSESQNSLLHQPTQIVMSEIHPCFIFMDD